MNIKKEFELLTVHLFRTSKLVCSSLFKALLLRQGLAKASLISTGHVHFAQTRNKIQGKEASRSYEFSRHVSSERIVFKQSSSHLYWYSEKRIWASELNIFPSIILMSWRANKAPSLPHILYLGMTSLHLQIFETDVLIFPISRVCVYAKECTLPAQAIKAHPKYGGTKKKQKRLYVLVTC